MMGEARLDTAFSSSDSLELHKAYYQFPVGDDRLITNSLLETIFK